MNKIEKYKGLEYLIWWNERMGHFCAYVKLPKNHKYEKIDDCKNMEIDCHWGLTFTETIKRNNHYPQKFTEGKWIGWDYGHFRDKSKFMDGYKWSEKEVEEECKNVINQLLLIK